MSLTPFLLTPPTYGTSPSQPVKNTHGYWYLSHTSRLRWHSFRNVLLACATTTASGVATTNKDQDLEYSVGSVDRLNVRRRPKQKVLDWEVVGQGRYGVIPEGIVETEEGLKEISSGKII
jgi:hypothetical protein